MFWMHFNDMKQFELTLLGTISIVAATILLSSTGGAAEWQGNALGEFVEAGEHGGRPYYRQRDTEGKADNFLYSEGGKWWVHDSMGKSVGKLSNPQNSPEPPTSGWVYFADQEYRDDDDSLTLELNVLNPPPYHTIRGEGAMVYKVGSSLGKYRFPYIYRAKKLKNMQQVGVGNVERGSTGVQESWRRDEVSVHQGGKDRMVRQWVHNWRRHLHSKWESHKLSWIS